MNHYRIEVYYNVALVDRGGTKYPAKGMLDGYDDGDALINVNTWLDIEAVDHIGAADKVWRLMNVVDGTELPAKLGLRSMCVGDVLAITDRNTGAEFTLACAMGWDDIGHDLNVTGRGTAAWRELVDSYHF